MSTVLTNGIIIPDNGNRNWGGDLANNWNIIDINVGYMTDVKNRVTTLENSVAENTANIEINTSNISALQTSKQDVIEDLETIRAGASAGATAVQPSALNNYVDLSSEQTIGGLKTFSNTITTNKELHYKDTTYDWTDASLNTWLDAGHVMWLDRTGARRMHELVGANNGIWKKSCYINENLYFSVNSNREIKFEGNSFKWNGINPGALSLPDPSPSVFISKSLPSSGGTIAAEVDGWFEIRAQATSPNAFIQLSVAGGNATYAKNTGDILIISAPVRAGVSVTIFYKDIETPTVCRLVPCLGNV